MIDPARLLADLDELARIGATESGGVTRVAYSEADRAGREWVAAKLREVGLEVSADPAGNLIMLGTGKQHWSIVHVADLADFFRRVLENDSAQGYYVVGNGLNPTVAELTEAAAVATAAPGAVPGSDEEARARLGDYFAEVLLLDQGTAATRARSELGWLPTRPGLVDEFRHGSYRR